MKKQKRELPVSISSESHALEIMVVDSDVGCQTLSMVKTVKL